MRASTIAALTAAVSLSACGACNCGLPGRSAVVAVAPGVTPTPVAGTTPTPAPGTTLTPTLPGATPTPVVVVPPGVVPPAPTPPPATLSCSQSATAAALGAALTPFAILAGSAVTNTGLTVVTYASGASTAGVNDDLVGVSPATAVGGFYPAGTDADGPNAIYGAGYNTNAAVPIAAQAALTTAYNTFAGMAATTSFPAGQDLSQAAVPGYPTGTLPPGVYASPSTLGILAGNLTLNGGGNPQSVFVFQAASTLTTTLNGGAGGNVILTNGASACNIYWQVGSSATLGGASFYGNVLALTSVSLTSSTQFTGRALARNGAVSIATATLVTNPGGK
jgi:hypothetical protein